MGWTGSSKALVGANAVVYAAGAGPLGITAAAATPKAARNQQNPELKIVSEIEGLRGQSVMMATGQQVRSTTGVVGVKT